MEHHGNATELAVILELFEVRHQVAHAKPRQLQETNTKPDAEALRRSVPKMEWETVCSITFADKAYTCTDQVAEAMWSAAGFTTPDLRGRGRSYTLSARP